MSETKTPVEVAAEAVYDRISNVAKAGGASVGLLASQIARDAFGSVGVEGLAEVLGKHTPDETSYDAGDLHGCQCWEWEGRDWDAYHRHVAEAIKGWLTKEGA